jgi:hypothetical protein
MEIIIGWILMGLISCYANRDAISTKGEQFWIMIFAPIVFLCVVFNFAVELLFFDSPAIGKKK